VTDTAGAAAASRGSAPRCATAAVAHRPPVDQTIAAFIERLARENPTWGDQRSGANCSSSAAASAHRRIRRILKLRRIPPAPLRTTDTSWRRFLRAQASTMLAVGFFHVDCAITLKRIYVYFALEVRNRYVLGSSSWPQWAPCCSDRRPGWDVFDRPEASRCCSGNRSNPTVPARRGA
jgi:hypothetical protein